MQRRSFTDMLEIVHRITSGKQQRCTDNLNITLRLVKKLGLEESFHKLKYVHVAGTKGKGTTSFLTSELLQVYGAKVGLFTSPHLVDIRERIVVNGEMLSQERFAKYFFDVYDRHESLAASESEMDREVASKANFFRLMFLTSIHAFASEGVNIGVMEVGIGGRIDATNIIQPDVCAITALGMDHMEVLGNTIEAIASEKAGIMKTGVPCFSAPQTMYPSTRAVLMAKAKEVDCPISFLDEGVVPYRQWPPLAIGGAHAVENSKLAFLLARHMIGVPVVVPLSPLETAVFSHAKMLGRSQIIKVSKQVTVYLDGAHTPESMAAAASWFFSLPETQRTSKARNVLLFYSSRDAKALFKTFMPYTKQLTKAVLCTIRSPRAPATTTASASSAASSSPSEADPQEHFETLRRSI